jgi:hypothetical protein
MLESTIGVDSGPVREVLVDFEGRLEKEKGVCEKRLMDRLEEKGISGSAVIPNIAADPEWIGLVAQTEEALKGKLNSSELSL